MCQQEFIASEGQTRFLVTKVELTQFFLVTVDGILITKGYYKNNNTVIFKPGLRAGTEVIIMN